MSDGSITERIRELIPVTYQALSNATYYGPNSIQRHIDVAKFRFFGTAVAPALEATTYDHFTLDYVAKASALRIIPAGVDFWGDQMTSMQAREESITYPDRIASLWKIHERLLSEIRQDRTLFEKLNPPFLTRPGTSAPKVSDEGDFLTPDPSNWGSGSTQSRFGAAERDTDDLPWGDWG